ncbi:MAG TPA: cytochrome b/b6 domain-containing protein [Roseiarcus sp.]|jgi:thiosulfate reductase cytochrome b subunit|nr:cytochrome b/b6 domain-containing protein [Roseiarcus sp.]
MSSTNPAASASAPAERRRLLRPREATRDVGRVIRSLVPQLRGASSNSATGEVFYRHRLPVRITHWINALCILFLLGSGLNIFNAHPSLYWGKYGADADKPFFSIGSEDAAGGTRGYVQLGPWRMDTTGVLGWSKSEGEYVDRAWPDWMTIPSFQDLADARHWHFLFAWLLAINGAVYLTWGVVSRHLKRDIVPTGADVKAIPSSIVEHVKLKHPAGEAAKRYNPLQRLAYLGVMLLIALMVLTGLTMSPGFDAVCPWLLDVFGGRQSARSIHFICASLVVLFVVVHLVEVVLAGAINEVRSMLTGRYVVPEEHCP